ncbi:hypothetical protein ABPG77_004514 [Micractinium sp. CCAP 211/92]
MEGLEGPRSASQQAIEYLLNRNFLLTALELVQEAGEAGLAHEVESLIQFFKNPALFPPEEVAACNPENGALFAQVAHERQQQLSQAQYELSLAREQLAALAVERTSAEQETASALPTARANGGLPSYHDAQLSPAQLRTLHGAVLAHLQAHGFKVAAVSLSKEARLAGGAAAAPAPAASLAGMYAAAQQLEAQSTRLHELEAQAERQARELAAARHELEETRGKEAVAAAELEFLRGKLPSLEQALEQAQEQQQQEQQQQQRDDQRKGQQGQQEQQPQASQRLGAAGALVEVAACMPRVLPNLLINKREELVPALCALCQEHPQAAGRRQLAGLLFGLIKKPSVAQRGMITEACVGLATRIGPARTLLELVPHLQDQVRHEAVERRLLVTEAAGVLVPCLPPTQAAATVLRLLEALLHDSQPQVRCQALLVLGRLTATLAFDAGVFAHVLRLLLDAAADGSSDVTQLLLQTTLPAVLDWAGHSELLVTQLLPQAGFGGLSCLPNSMPTVCASQDGDPGSACLQQEQGRATAGSQGATPSSQPDSACNGALLQRQLEAAAFAAWARAGGCPEDWHVVFYIAVSAVPELLASALLVATLPEAPLLTQRFVAALKATCLSFGEAFAAAAVVPQLHAAAGIPAWSSPAPAAGPAAGPGPESAARRDEQCNAQLHTRLAEAGLLAAPAAPAQLVLQTPTALALLLAGALPYAGASAVGACLRRLCTDGGSGSGSVWALQHPRAFVAAVRSAAEVQLVQAQLVPLMWELVAGKQPGCRLAAALLAGAAAPSLPKQQVTRQLLPLLSTLGSDRDAAACRASIAAASVVFGCLGGEQEVQEALFSTLDDMLIAGGHTAEMALLAVLAPLAPRASSQQLEWLLQRLLLMLAAMHQRGSSGKTPSQLAEAAATAFVALRQIEAHEFAEQRLHMHFAAALTALQREADLLDQPQRDALAAMVEDHEATAGPPAGGAGSNTLGMQLPSLGTHAAPHVGTSPAAFAHYPAPQSPAGQQQSVPASRGGCPLAALFAGGSRLGADDDLPISAYLGSA